MIPVFMMSVTASQPKTDNEELDMYLTRIAQNDSDAFARFYEQTKASVYAYALSFLKNTHDAEDVLHDCYMNVHAAAATYKSNGKPMAWVMTITKNLCLQKLREQRRASDIPEEDWERYISAKEEMSVEDKLVLRLCMEKLTDEEREIVLLHAVSGLKHREIARIEEMLLSTELSKYNRAIKKLQLYWEKENQDDGKKEHGK